MQVLSPDKMIVDEVKSVTGWNLKYALNNETIKEWTIWTKSYITVSVILYHNIINCNGIYFLENTLRNE